MIDFDIVSKRFGGTPAVDSVTLSVARGETVALIGPSGCGKSTLLSLLVGLIPTDSGSIRIDDIEMTPATALSLRRRLGYVIQDGGLFPHLTAGGNVTLMAGELGWPVRRQAQRLSELAALTQLPEALLARYPAELSGGQRQRVSLMRALMLDPDVVILDEPLGALDPMIRAELQDELKAIFARLGKTALLVTHDLAEAAWLGDRIVLMNRGRIVQTGRFADLVERPAEPFVTRFVQAQDRHPMSPSP